MLDLEKMYLFLWSDLLIFCGRIDRALKEHQHHIIQLVIGLEGPFITKNESGDWEEKTALLIPADVDHICDARGKAILTLKFEPESTLGHTIQSKLLPGKKLVDLSHNPAIPMLQSEMVQALQDSNLQQFRAQLDQSIFQLFQLEVSHSIIDERIEAVLDYIQNNFSEPISTTDLTKVAFLSESRLLHLFKEQVGLPIRHYLLWTKVQQAIKYIIQGNSLTSAAHYAGFADAAHFSRTFLSRVGHPPSVVFKNSNSVQVFVGS